MAITTLSQLMGQNTAVDKNLGTLFGQMGLKEGVDYRWGAPADGINDVSYGGLLGDAATQYGNYQFNRRNDGTYNFDDILDAEGNSIANVQNKMGTSSGMQKLMNALVPLAAGGMFASGLSGLMGGATSGAAAGGTTLGSGGGTLGTLGGDISFGQALGSGGNAFSGFGAALPASTAAGSLGTLGGTLGSDITFGGAAAGGGAPSAVGGTLGSDIGFGTLGGVSGGGFGGSNVFSDQMLGLLPSQGGMDFGLNSAGTGGGFGDILSTIGKGAVSGAVGGGSNTGSQQSGTSGLNFGNLLSGLAQMYASNRYQDSVMDLYKDIDSTFKPGSAYEQQLREELDRRDSASGRRSQYGPRAVELQAKLADKRLGAASTLAGLLDKSNTGLTGLLQGGIYTGKESGLTDLFGNAVSGAANSVWDSVENSDFWKGLFGD